MDLCESVHHAFSDAPPIELAAHEVDLDGESGRCGPSADLVRLLDRPREATLGENRYWARIAGREVLVHADGPGGSGRYWVVHLVQREGHACLGGSTVAWRHLYGVDEVMAAQGLLPLPVLADVDQDGAEELVQFSGASVNPEWGNGGIVLALPARTLVEDRWVWDEPASRTLAGRLAEVYRALAVPARGTHSVFSPAKEVADALQRFADGRPCGPPPPDPGPFSTSPTAQ